VRCRLLQQFRHTEGALDAAITLGAQGYACFPCRDDKTPFPGSHGLKDACKGADSLQALWRRYPGALVGVATGPASGVSVLDVDVKHPEAVARFYRNDLELLPTRVHTTRSSGWHLLYRHQAGLKNSQSKIHKGVDVRGEGGYIVWNLRKRSHKRSGATGLRVSARMLACTAIRGSVSSGRGASVANSAADRPVKDGKL